MTSSLWTLGFLNQIGMPEIIFIFVIVLIIFGPKSLPSLGRALGQGIREFRGASTKLSAALDEAAKEEEKSASATLSEPRQIAPSAPHNTLANTSHTAPSEEKS